MLGADAVRCVRIRADADARRRADNAAPAGGQASADLCADDARAAAHADDLADARYHADADPGGAGQVAGL